MAQVNYTLVSEGTSDQALIPIINWIFRQKRSDLAINSAWANPAKFPTKPKKLSDKIRYSLGFFACDVLFVHRDSDNEPPENRYSEIEQAILDSKAIDPVYVCDIPVKTIEAWFLFDEQAIRNYVGNPDGKEDLGLPKINQIESIGTPKTRLSEAFEAASKSKGRRKKSYDTADSLIGFALEIETYAPLRQLPAFSRLEASIHDYLEKI